MDIDGEKLEQVVLALLPRTRLRKVQGDVLGKAFPGQLWTHCMRRIIFRTQQ